MKKTLLTALLSASILPFAQAQTITNAGMEQWEDAPFPNIYNIEFPSAWSGSDKLIADNALLMTAIGVTPESQITQSTDSYAGTYAARLETKFLGDTVGNLPALLVNAQMSLNMEALLDNPDLSDMSSFINFSGGTPVMGQQVDTVKAWVKLTADNEEPAAMIITAMQITSGSQGQDTLVAIGSANHLISPQGTEYVPVAAVMVYDNPANTATDTLIVAFTSSAFGAPGQNVDGNTLFVDEVSVVTSTPSSIDDLLFTAEELQIFPNPSAGSLQISIVAQLPQEGLQFQLTDIQGRVVHTSVLKQAKTLFDFSALPSGLY